MKQLVGASFGTLQRCYAIVVVVIRDVCVRMVSQVENYLAYEKAYKRWLELVYLEALVVVCWVLTGVDLLKEIGLF